MILNLFNFILLLIKLPNSLTFTPILIGFKKTIYVKLLCTLKKRNYFQATDDLKSH